MTQGPSLNSIDVSPDGAPLHWRLLLPPNLPQCAPKDRIPVKLEAETGGEIYPPERLPKQPYWPEPPHLLAAMLVESWANGKAPSMMQLTRDQLSQLLQPLTGEPSVFSFRNPKEPMPWVDGKLPDVHPHLVVEAKAPPKKDTPKPMPLAPEKSRREMERDLTPMVVDGSTNYLAITLPSRESIVYDEALELLKSHSFKLEPSNRKWWLRDRHKTLQFLAEHWDRLKNHYRAKFTPAFRKYTKKLKPLEARIHLRKDGDDFVADAELAAPGIEAGQIAQALNKGQPYLETHKGVFLLDHGKLNTMQEAQRRLTGDADRLLTPRVTKRITTVEAAAVNQQLEALDLAIEAPEEWKRRSGALSDLSALQPPPAPEALLKMLRPYQALGAAWLWHLYNNDLGGILADEMGLGKTVQALTVLSAIHQETQKPCLVVCPAGLVENWRREAKKFAPDLKVFAHHRASRLESAEHALQYGLVVTSYNTLARDEEIFHTAPFAAVVGDEAQHVKNRQTQNAKALRGVLAKRRFLLTGTPVENSLDDLAALFEFVLPGYVQPPPAGASREEREWHGMRIKDRAAQYILRRSKREVAPELPEKIEQVFYCEFSDEQEALYRKVEESARREVFELEMANASEGKLRVAAFKQLLRMRQACIDPRLVEKEAADAIASTKLDAFRELLEESIDGGHRMLVFSQFTSALALLKDELEAQKMPYLYLDGSTPNRAALCEQFNEDDSIPVFLISLKAGGTGLNLTGADTVVHYDPWWNPAVEAQATDRAHRIGQSRTVTSYKLIVSNSVEERVLSMQRQKAALLKDLFEASEAANAKIGFADMKALMGEE
ncbi:DEAD/DEAH box helicase [Cerasicoccus fimbriatus]|uniref:DEAD/DEAH box helicase n=1 Tax=Cerasicoccus fimbriatus TaxID=3014554 RepID=UPI0022B5BB61|nr:DEAD/DEAH box helicase [Cerasicoccus sp. TK19100]